MQKIIKAGIIGGAGYTGGELIRLLLHHPNCEISFVHSESNAGNLISDVHADLLGDTDITFSSEIDDADVLFLCAGHGAARKFLENNSISDSTKIIDLSHDFRLKNNNKIKDRNFVYGLPELNISEIKNSKNIANPGCFATAIQLGLLPLAKAGLLKEIYTTGITGSTGAGQALSPTSHFSWRANNIQPYKTHTHQHLSEMEESLQQLQATDVDINFVPWRGDFTRGIFISSQMPCELSLTELNVLYDKFYEEHPFTIVSKKEISLKQCVNTNKCLIYLEKVGDKLIIHSAIDNLLKGASGQAVQNMNLMFGLNESAGLMLKSIAF